MIDQLVQSAMQTGWLSVESEGLIRQLVSIRTSPSTDQAALQALVRAMERGDIQREAPGSCDLPHLARR